MYKAGYGYLAELTWSNINYISIGDNTFGMWNIGSSASFNKLEMIKRSEMLKGREDHFSSTRKGGVSNVDQASSKLLCPK